MSPGSTEPSALYEDAVDQVELALDVEMREATPPESDESAEPADPGTARSLPTHLRSESMQSNATATGSDADSSTMPSQSQRRHTNLSLSSNPFLQRSLGGILRGDGRENRSNAPSPVSAAFPQRGELPDWYHDPTMQNTPSPSQSNFIGSQGFPQDGFPQQGFLPDWPTDMLPKAEVVGGKEASPEPDASEEGEGWGTPQSTPGKEHGHSATKTETEISESLWPSTSASKADEEPSASPTSTASTADDIVVSVQVTSGPPKEPSANTDDRTVTEEKDLIKLDSDTPSSDTKTRERPRPKVATGFLQRQLQSIMRSDKSKAKPPPAPTAPAPTREAEASTSPDVPPTPPPTQEYNAGLEQTSAKEEREKIDDRQGSDSDSENNDGGDESYSLDGSDGEEDFVDSPSSPFKPSDGQDGEMNGDDAPRHNNPSFKSLSPIGKLKPSASVFVPRAVVTSPPRMMPKVEAPQPEQRPPSVTSSAFTFGYPSTVEHRKLSLASTASPRNPSKVLASLPILQPSAPAFKPTAPAFQPSAPVFQPGAPAFQPSASVFQPGAPVFQPAGTGFGASNPQTAGTGGALGLFTFTHNLRPTAAEFRPNGVRLGASPLRQNASLKPHPPELDLSKADPTSKPFELGSAFFPSNEGKLEFGNGEVSLLMREKRPVKIERPEPPAALLPRRDPASPRQLSQRERDSMSEAVCFAYGRA